jgi:hypothetical protein
MPTREYHALVLQKELNTRPSWALQNWIWSRETFGALSKYHFKLKPYTHTCFLRIRNPSRYRCGLCRGKRSHWIRSRKAFGALYEYPFKVRSLFPTDLDLSTGYFSYYYYCLTKVRLHSSKSWRRPTTSLRLGSRSLLLMLCLGQILQQRAFSADALQAVAPLA